MRTWCISFTSFYITSVMMIAVTSKSYAQDIFDTLITTQSIVVLFDSDSDFVKPRFIDSIHAIAMKANEHETFQISLSAHTDDIGSFEYNDALALKRLNSVSAILLDYNISSSSIISSSYGEKVPLFSVLNEKNRALNRRVEIDLLVLRKVKRILTTVTDAISGEKLQSLISVKSGSVDFIYEFDGNGYSQILYPLDHSIRIETQAKNYLYKNLNLKSHILKKLDTITIKMLPLNAGRTFSLDGLNFVSNKCILLQKSISELYNLRDFMKINVDKCVEIGGHINLPNTPPLDTSHIYFDLSASRANVIYDSLRIFGISKKRMYTKGYGNWQMKFPKAISEKEQAANRRVELRIQDCKQVAEMRNVIVKRPSVHGYIKINKLYNPESFKYDLAGLRQNTIEHVKKVILQIVDKGHDPEKYTYKKLFKMK